LDNFIKPVDKIKQSNDGQRYREVYVKTKVGFIVPQDITSP